MKVYVIELLQSVPHMLGVSLFLSVANCDNLMFTLLDHLKFIISLGFNTVMFNFNAVHRFSLMDQESTLPNENKNIWIFAETECSHSFKAPFSVFYLFQYHLK